MRTLLRVVLGLVLLVSGCLKLARPVETVLAAGAYDLLPARAVVAGAFALPGVEIAVGAALLVGFALRGAAVAAAGLAGVFLLFAGSAWARGLAVDCGCFGSWTPWDRAGPGTVALDVALLAMALLLATRGPGSGQAGPVDPARA